MSDSQRSRGGRHNAKRNYKGQELYPRQIADREDRAAVDALEDDSIANRVRRSIETGANRRPYKLTAITIMRVYEAARYGASVALCAKAAGVSLNAFREWRATGEQLREQLRLAMEADELTLAQQTGNPLAEYPEGEYGPATSALWDAMTLRDMLCLELLVRMHEAEFEAADNMLKQIKRAAEGRSWMAAAWLLERRYEEYRLAVRPQDESGKPADEGEQQPVIILPETDMDQGIQYSEDEEIADGNHNDV